MPINYIVMRLEAGAMNYNTIIAKYPDSKTAIDEKLAADGYKVNEDGTVTKI